MRKRMSPPAWARGVLWLIRDAVARESITGDLDEEFRRLAAAPGARAARRWYRRAVFRSILDHRRSTRSRRPPWASPLAGLVSDVVIGLRMLRKDPVLTGLSTGALALGIGLSTVAFAVVYGSVLRGLPFEAAGRLVHFERAQPAEGRDSMAVTPHDYEAWRASNVSFEDLGAYVEAMFLIGDEDGLTEQNWGLAISANVLDLLRVEPILGRGFRPEEDVPGGPEVMLIGYRTWRGRFAGDPEIVGRDVQVNGAETRIVGVMPPEFGFPVAEQFWRPLRLDTTTVSRGSGRLDVFGRMLPGVSIEQARDDMRRASAQLGERFPETNAGIHAVLRTFAEEYVGPDFAAQVWTMLAAALLVALLASVNVATLLLARSTRRGREVALRTALGAARWRVARQLFVETSMLVAIGSLGGIAVARVGTSLFQAYWAGTSLFALPHGPEAPFWWRYGVDTPAVLFVVAVTAATAVVTGLLPAWRVSKANVSDALRQDDRGNSAGASGWLGKGLVVAEVALCTGLLLCAGLVVRSIVGARVVGAELDAPGLYTASGYLPAASVFSGAPGRAPTEYDYGDPAAQLQFWNRAQARLAAIPDLEGFALSTALPVDAAGVAEITLPGGENQGRRARAATITPGFFDLLGVALVRGRAFTDQDEAASEPVVIVNTSFVQRYFPEGEALNRRIRLGGEDSTEPWLTIVGVAPDLWMDGTRNRDREGIYLPMDQSVIADPDTRLGRFGLRYVDLLLRPRGDAAVVLGAVRRAIAEIDGGVPIYGLGAMETRIAQRTGHFRLHGSFYLLLGAVALMLATMGLYGVISHVVGSRTREIGTRMALGARPLQVQRLVLSQGMRQVAVGALLGLVLAAWLQPPLQRILFGVRPWDPATMLVVLIVLGAAGAAACWIPACRAARVDPLTAMRS